MNIKHFKIVREKDGYSVIIYLDPNLEEFGGELGEITKDQGNLKQQIQRFVKKRFPKLKIQTAKIMVGSILITTVSLGPSIFNNRVEAATHSNQAAVQTEYIVQPGDSLSVIAKKYGTTVNAIVETNKLKSTLIKVGERLKIPTTIFDVEPKIPSTEKDNKETNVTGVTTYKVVAGDSLSVIAKRFNTSVQEIKKLNNLKSDTIFVGQTLKLPSKTGSPITEKPSVSSTYTVVKGDVLSIIAKRFNTTVQELKRLNRLSSDKIYIGQTLKIPSKETEPTESPIKSDGQQRETENEDVKITATYTVVKGDTLSLLAQRFNTTVNDIKQVNKLTSNTIYIGQKLQIPNVGEQTGEQEIKVPIVLTINSITSINVSNQKDYTISGKTTPHSTVDLKITDENNQEIIRKVKSDANGNFSETLSLMDLEDGDITVSVISKDETGNTSEEIVETIVKDTMIEDITLMELAPITSENVHHYSLSGKAEPGATVFFTLLDSNNEEVFLNTTVDQTGNFQMEMDASSLADGPITLTYYTADQSGNKSNHQEVTFMKETLVPPPVIDEPKQINAQNANHFSIIGTARPNSTVEVVISDGVNPDIIKQTSSDLNGEFLIDVDVRSLLDTELIITASQLTINGVKSEVTEMTVEKDTSAPGLPELSLPDFINQESQYDYQINGIGENDAKIYVKATDQNNDIVESNGIVDEEGIFHFPVDLSTLQDGEIAVEVYQVDKAGNLSATSKKVITKDTIPPEQVEINALPGIYSGNETDFYIQGRGAPLLQIEMTVTDGKISETFSFMTDGVGKFNHNIDMSRFSDGEIAITFSGMDRAGNKNVPTTINIVKDTIIENIQLDEMDEFVNRANQNEFIISGESPEEGATITIVASDGTTNLTETTEVINGKFNLPINLSSLKDGPVTIQFSQKDVYKNERVLGVHTVQKDTIVESPVISMNGFYYQGNQLIFGLNGAAETGAEITVTFYDDHENIVTSKTTTTDENGFYSIAFPINENDRAKITQTVITQTDKAGNTSDMAPIALKTHTVSPNETLSAIAKRYNTSVDAIRKINQLTSDLIHPGQEIILPLTAKELINLGYMYYGDLEDSETFIKETAASMNIVAPSYFEINPDGTLKLTWALNTKFVEAMHAQGVRVVPYLSNNWDRELGRAMLQNKEVATTQIAEAIERYNLDGVNVDIENVTHEDKEDFTEFVRLLREKIPSHKEVSVAVAANPNGWTKGWHGSYDYKQLAESSDYLMFMTYDESFVGGDPGPVASYNWVERSIIRALTEGVSADKIVLGIAQYGRYWKEGAQIGGYGISNRQVEKLIAEYDGKVLFDEESLSPVAKITIDKNDPKPVVNGKTLTAGTYTIWYENAESIRYKLSLVSKYNLRGVGNWNIVQGTDGIWNNYATSLPMSVPVSSPYTPPQQEEVKSETYTVAAGDSLSKIALKFNTTIEEIKELNHLTSDMIYVGQSLLIPNEDHSDGKKTVDDTLENPLVEEVHVPIDEEEALQQNDVIENDNPIDTTPEEKQKSETNTYVVSAGDSLSVIAKKYNTTINAIKTANNLTTDTIYVGQKLTIPTSSDDKNEKLAQTSHTVKSGDSLSVIAKKFNTTVQSIKNTNQLTSDKIFIGQKLTIPLSDKESEKQTYVHYTVKSGDSLSVIAKRYNSTVNDIKRVNKLQSDMIKIGQVLKIPR